MPAQGASQPMESLLKQEVACSEQLLECLQRERGALAQHDLDALEQITRTKLEHSEQLERLEQERRHQLAMLGFDQDGEGLRQYCKTLPNYTQLFQLWQQVISNIEACQADNLTNGGILESARQQVERALGILRGESGNPAVYGSDGDTSANLGQRELGKV